MDGQIEDVGDATIVAASERCEPDAPNAIDPNAAETMDPAVERDFVELTSLIGSTMRGLKRVGPPPEPVAAAVHDAGLGDRHMPAVVTLALTGPLSVSELARRLGLELSSTSAIVGQLSRAGLVDRSEDESDRRRTIVRVHEDFRDLLTVWTRQALGPLHRTLERLPAEQRAHFMEGWRVLHEEATRDA